MPIRQLREDFSFSGEWYLPCDPERKISGHLKYDSDGSVLHLNHAFTPLRGNVSVVDEPPRYDVIHGTSTTGEAITILNAQRMGVDVNFGSGGLRQPERIMSPSLIVGAHVPADYNYPYVTFRIPGLETWLSRVNIGHSIVAFPESNRIVSQTFSIETKPAVEHEIPAIQAMLKIEIGYSLQSNRFKSLSIEVSVWVSFKHARPQPLEWHIEQYSKFSTMLAFLSGTPMPTDCIQATVDDSQHRVSVLVPLKKTPICTHASPHDYFLNQSDLESNFGVIVSRWYEEIESVYTPSQLALGVLASDNLWLHVEFLSLMQALEGFHRAKFTGNYMDEDGYEQIKRELTSALPKILSSDHKDALRSRIKYGNQISLRKRLDELVNSMDKAIAINILGPGGKVPRSWIDTRNYHTHWDEELRYNVIDGQDMYYANVRMRHWIRILFLLLMGVPPETCIRALNGSSGAAQQLASINLIDTATKSKFSDLSGVIMTISKLAEPDNADDSSP